MKARIKNNKRTFTRNSTIRLESRFYDDDETIVTPIGAYITLRYHVEEVHTSVTYVMTPSGNNWIYDWDSRGIDAGLIHGHVRDGNGLPVAAGDFEFRLVANKANEDADLLLSYPLDTVPSSPNSRTITAIGNAEIFKTDVFVYIDKVDSSDINLPDSIVWAAYWAATDFDLYIVDISGTIATNNQRIVPFGMQKIDGSLTDISITTDYGGFSLRPVPGGGWVVR